MPAYRSSLFNPCKHYHMAKYLYVSKAKTKTMKKLWIVALAGFMVACNNDNDTAENENDTSMRPRPVTEGVTNSTMIVNDSVIVPDTNNQGVNPSAGVDTMGPMQKTGNRNNNRPRQ